VRDTTAFSLRCASITLTSSTLAFLRRWLAARTSDIAEAFGSFIKDFTTLLPVHGHIVHNISSQGQVEDFSVQIDDFLSKLASHERKDGNLEWVFLADDEGALRPRLRHQKVFIRTHWSNLTDLRLFYFEFGSDHRREAECLLLLESKH
jgi:hypothetical protein